MLCCFIWFVLSLTEIVCTCTCPYSKFYFRLFNFPLQSEHFNTLRKYLLVIFIINWLIHLSLVNKMLPNCKLRKFGLKTDLCGCLFIDCLINISRHHQCFVYGLLKSSYWLLWLTLNSLGICMDKVFHSHYNPFVSAL